MSIFKVNRKTILLLIVCIVSVVVSLISTIIMKPIIDIAIYKNEFDRISTLIFILLTLVIVILDIVRRYLTNRISCDFEGRIIPRIINNYIHNKDVIDKESNILTSLTSNAFSIKLFISGKFDYIIYYPLSFLLIFGYLLYEYTEVAVFIIPFVIFSTFFNIKFSNLIQDTSNDILKYEHELQAFEAEMFKNTHYINATGVENYVKGKYKNALEEMLSQELRLIKVERKVYIPALINEYMPLVVLVLVVFLNMDRIGLSYGDFIVLVGLVNQISLPFTKFLRYVNEFRALKPKLDKIRNIIGFEEDEVFNGRKEDQIIEKGIHLQNVSFSYDNENFIISNISFNINQGEQVCIVGKSGSGKSTILKLVMGFIKPSKGNISVQNIKTTDNKQIIWNNIAYIDSNLELFDDSIEYNITYERDTKNIDMKKLSNIVQSLDIEDIFENKQSIGENGSKLSGGQRLKVALARALYKDTDILILDEPDYALDEKSVESLINIIKSSGKTVLMTTHNEAIKKAFKTSIEL